MKHPPLKTRENTSDGFVAREPSYPRLAAVLTPDDVVLDMGGYIGTTVRAWADRGVRHIIVCEPDPANWKVLQENTLHIPFVTYVKAAVLPQPTHDGRIPFYRSKDDRYAAGHTVRAKRGYIADMVLAVGVNELIDKYSPTILKIDIEHVEAQVLMAAKLDNIKAVAIEYSFGRKSDVPICTEAHEMMLASGLWDSYGNFNPKAWSSVIVYIRKGTT
jgi:FkbM family methyltransferase